MHDRSDELLKRLKVLAQDAMGFAENAYKAIFYTQIQNDAAIVGYINAAFSVTNTAKAIYYCNFESMASQDIDLFFHQMDVYVKEVLSNVASGHSHQWSDIEYNDLEVAYLDSSLS